MKAPDNLDCFEYRVRLKGGTTRPHLVVGRDGSGRNVPVVLKLKDPGVSDGHYGGSSLAAELICSLIASEVGLWTPTPYIARVSNEFAENCPDGNVRALFLRNVGLNFACEYLEDCLAWSDPRTSVSEELRQQLEDLLSFDAAVINGDRKAEKPNLLRRGDTLVAIDVQLRRSRCRCLRAAFLRRCSRAQ